MTFAPLPPGPFQLLYADQPTLADTDADSRTRGSKALLAALQAAETERPQP